MINFYPSVLNVSRRNCLVIGYGDAETVTRTLNLLEADARVTVISPGLSNDDSKRLVNAGATVLRRSFKLSDLTDQFFVILCVKDDPALTKSVAARCRQRRTLLCAIDQPDYCDIVNVSVYNRGLLKIMISTSGAAPGLSKQIRLGLEKHLKSVPFEKFLSGLADLREKLEKELPNAGQRIDSLLEALKGFEFKASAKLPKRKRGEK